MAFLKKILRKINTRIFEKSTMMGQFFENTLKRAGVFTPAPSIETSLYACFNGRNCNCRNCDISIVKKKTDFFGGHAMVKLVFTRNNTWFLAHVLLRVNHR